MAEERADPERTENHFLNPMPAAWTGMKKARVDELVNVQTEFFNKLQETNRQWLERAQSQATLASELASKMTAARSLPEAIAAYQEWTTREVELLAQDGKHLFDHMQKLMEASTSLLSSYFYITRHPAE
jgi:hypothetical protein